MPALPIPCYDGNAMVLVNSGAVIMCGRLFTDAGHSSEHHDYGFMLLTIAEFKAIQWKRVLSSELGNSSASIRISIYGINLSETARDVSRISLDKVGHKFYKLVKLHSPRIKWLAKYAEIKERRTAVAMACHERLGRGSMLGCLSSDAIQAVIAFAT
jgi:hypothetical protein